MQYPERCTPIQGSLYNLTHRKITSNLLQHVPVSHKTSEIWPVRSVSFIQFDCFKYNQQNFDGVRTCQMNGAEVGRAYSMCDGEVR